ncbi:MAG: hypothetical protein PGN16_07305, partial [Sphingomonas phyllosphaerae]
MIGNGNGVRLTFDHLGGRKELEERLVSQHEPRPKTARDSGYLPTLDGWRAIAVSLVIGSHSVSMIRRAS